MSRCLLALVLPLALLPATARGWGFEAHWFVMDRAIALLPPELRPFFERHRAAVVERAIDPDTWRDAGFEHEDPNHFLDIDWEGFGPHPFDGLPRDYEAAVAKFGRARIEQYGKLPWRVEEMYDRLRRAFEAYPRRGAGGRYEVIHTAAWLGHYVGDAHVPFHAVVNYNGQLTGQTGIHGRFESTLFQRYRDRWTIDPPAMAPIRTPRDYVFDVVIEGSQLVAPILASDREAIGPRDVYDDAYYETFFRANRPVMERRLNESIAAIAAMIAGAWEAAGKPPVPADPSANVQRRRR